jgi:endonuclease YncB( thermonuclease family)
MLPILIAAAGLTIGQPFDCRVMSVSDGDTWTCEDGLRVRMWGASAPDRVADGKREATRWTASRIAGQDLRCVVKGYNPATPRYKKPRVVGQCSLDGVDFGCALIRSGHGIEDTDFSLGAYRGCTPAPSVAR